MTTAPNVLGSESGRPRPRIAADGPNARSRREGWFPALLMALVVAGPTATLAGWLLRTPDPIDGPGGWPAVLAITGGPAVLLILLALPSLLLGRRPDRLTAVRGWLWSLVAVLLFVLPGIGLATMRIMERPNLTGDPDRPATISTWVGGSPGVAMVFVALIGALLIVGPSWLAGYWARGKNRYVAIATAVAMTLLGVGALAIYAYLSFAFSLSAHSDATPGANLLAAIPVVTWLAAPPVAVLAGAERREEDEQ